MKNNQPNSADKQPLTSINFDKPTPYHANFDNSIGGKIKRLRAKYTFKRFNDYISKYGPNRVNGKLRILEIGSGPGVLLQHFEEWHPNADIYGVEYDYRLIEESRQRISRAIVLQDNAEQLNMVMGQKFDVIISLHVIEHLFHPDQMLDQIHTLLNDDGIFILATPNLNSWGVKLMKEKWQGYIEDHVALKTFDGWSTLLKQKKFTPLLEHSTFFSGIPIFNNFPLNLVNITLLFLIGSLPWKSGEAYVAVWKK